MSITEHKVELLHPDPKDKIKWSHKLLPNPIKGFRMLIVAPSNTGKSVLTSFMFGSPKMPYLKFFRSNVFIFSTTAKLGSMNMPHVKEENIKDSFDVEFIRTLWEEQDALIEKYGRAKTVPILLIFDDVVADLNAERKEYLKKVFLHGRHSGFSTCLCSQQWKSVPKPVRMNATNVIVMLLASTAERLSISSEMPFPEKKFLAVVDDAISDAEYSFLTINLAEKKERRLQLRLSSSYYDLDEIEV
jgi:hypothetical protein